MPVKTRKFTLYALLLMPSWLLGCDTQICDFDGDGLCPPQDCDDYDISAGLCNQTADDSPYSPPLGHFAAEDLPNTLLAAQGQEGLGSAIAGAGDINGDGFDDLIVGAYHHWTDDSDRTFGAAYILPGPVLGENLVFGSEGDSYLEKRTGMAYVIFGPDIKGRTHQDSIGTSVPGLILAGVGEGAQTGR